VCEAECRLKCLGSLDTLTHLSCLALPSKAKKGGEWEYLLQKHDAPLDETVTDKAFFDITIGEQAVGRIVFGLFGKVSLFPITITCYLSAIPYSLFPFTWSQRHPAFRQGARAHKLPAAWWPLVLL